MSQNLKPPCAPYAATREPAVNTASTATSASTASAATSASTAKTVSTVSAASTALAAKPARLAIVGVLFATAILACLLTLAGCSGSKDDVSDSPEAQMLNTEASATAPWGLKLDYKVNDGWKESTSGSSEDTLDVSYGTEDIPVILWIKAQDQDAKRYSKETEEEWLESTEEFYKATPKERAESLNGVGFDEYTEDDFPTYSDFSIEKVGFISVDGVAFTIFEEHLTETYSDAGIKKLEEKGKKREKTEESVTFYAVAKKQADIEIKTDDKALLDAFMNTLEIKR